MRQSPSIEEARARYSSALSQVDIQRAQLRPQVQGGGSANYGYSHTNLDADQFDGSDNDNSLTGVAGALASWDLDLWGKQRAAVRSRIGQARAAEAEQAAAATSIQYNIANTYYNWQTLKAELAVAQQIAEYTSHLRDLINARVQSGMEDPQNLDSANQQLAAARQQVAQLKGDASLDVVQLAALVGVSPDELDSLEAKSLPSLATSVPDDASLNLLGRRPDIAAKRWQIESALSDINQARAAYYPDVSLTGLGGFLRLYPDLNSSNHVTAGTAGIGPSITLPIFSGGRLRAQYQSAQAELDSNVASYNSTVVDAARDLSRQVYTLRQLGDEKTQQHQQFEAVADQNKRIDWQRRRGLIDDRSYLNGLVNKARQQSQLIQLNGQILSTHLSLIHELGGGYKNDTLPALPEAANKEQQ